MSFAIEIPEPYSSAIRAGRPGEVCDCPASSGAERYARALARIQVGRDREAREDLESSAEKIGDVALVEIAYLDLRERIPPEPVLRSLREIQSRAAGPSVLRARSLHLAGLALGRLRRIGEAVECLVEASRTYREIRDRGGRGQVEDTLGILHLSCGRIDLALSCFAVSIVEKTLAGDRYGIAITLGNLGRAHFQAGRYRDAIDCLELDLELAGELGDRRAEAKLLGDLGRVRAAQEDLPRAEEDLRRSLRLAVEARSGVLELFARKELALVLLRSGRIEESQEELAAARALKEAAAEPSLAAHLRATEGEVLLASGDPLAASVLEEAARRFEEADLPDPEIVTLLALSRAYVERKLRRMAEASLEKALDRARQTGQERHLRPIREAMTLLETDEGMKLESDRAIGSAPAGSAPGGAAPMGRGPTGYVLLEKLGEGAFGEVHKAFDPARDEIVALKIFHLERIYGAEQRENVLTSARVELEAASRIRHPGVARVLALGRDPNGSAYLVQEFVHGRSLRRVLEGGPGRDPFLVLKKIEQVAGALETLHRQRVFHRDLKPENILLRAPDDAPVLVDFGVAHLGGFERGFGAVGVAGTFHYIAPELFRSEAVTDRADVFSLGVILHEWLAGRLPWDFSGGKSREPSAPWPRPEPRPIEEARSDLPRGFGDLVRGLLSSDPLRRPDAAGARAWCQRIEVQALADQASEEGTLPLMTGSTPGLDLGLGQGADQETEV